MCNLIVWKKSTLGIEDKQVQWTKNHLHHSRRLMMRLPGSHQRHTLLTHHHRTSVNRGKSVLRHDKGGGALQLGAVLVSTSRGFCFLFDWAGSIFICFYCTVWLICMALFVGLSVIFLKCIYDLVFVGLCGGYFVLKMNILSYRFSFQTWNFSG